MRSVLFASLLAVSRTAVALTLNSCATENTGSEFSTSEWMSIGLCKTNCNGYAVAILQEDNCWCSNTIPGNTVDMNNCNVACPHYSPEMCATTGYYGYLVLGNPTTIWPSSSSSSSSATSTSSTSTSTTTTSSSSSSSSTSTSSTTLQTASTQPETTTTSSSSSSTSTSSSTSRTSLSTSTSTSSFSSTSSSSSSSSSTSDESKTTSSTTSDSSLVKATTIYKTVNGSQTQLVSTQYVTEKPSRTATPESSSGSSTSTPTSSGSKNSFFDSKGKVAGTFTAVGLVALAIILGVLYCCCCIGCCGMGGRYATHSDEENEYSSDEASFNNEKGIAIVAANGTPNGTYAKSEGLTRDSSHKSVFSFFNNNGSTPGSVARNPSRKKLLPKSPSSRNEATHSATNSFGDNDIMIPIAELDHRLEPGTLFTTTNESKKSLGDNIDYSRRILKVTNPE